MATANLDAEYGDPITRRTNRGPSVIETRGRKAGAVPLEQIQAKTLEYFGQGMSVAQVMAKVDRTPQTYQLWRTKTPGYANKVDRIRARLKGEAGTKQVPDFETFRREYLKTETYWHQRQWIDLLEGNDPANLDPAQVYHPGGRGKNRILINTPPNHGKSTTITMDYVVYKICANPAYRVIILSQSKEFAEQFLLGIKSRLTDEKYEDLINDFGPGPNGFVNPKAPWAGDKIYVWGRDPSEKDPTVQSIGVRGQIYGARADLIIMDDCVTLETGNRRDKIISKIRTEISSRLESPADPRGAGRLLVVGTRLSLDDLYGELLRQDNRGAWTYLTQPAILEYADDVDDWRTLWPERFPGYVVDEIMKDYGEDQALFNLVYQQEAAPEDATFPDAAVRGCIVPNAGTGLPEYIRPNGTLGLYIVGGIDPAASGNTAIVVLGVDKRTKQRYLIDCLNQRNFKPHLLREKVIEWTQRYKVNEWRIEKNGLQTLLSQDRDLRVALLGLGARVSEHHTVEYGHTGKWDPDYGVASLSPLFLGALEQPKANLITIPWNGTHRATRELVDQLVAWEPKTIGKTDLVMALWFADLGARKQLIQGQTTHATNRWATRGRDAQRRVLSIQDYLENAS